MDKDMQIANQSIHKRSAPEREFASEEPLSGGRLWAAGPLSSIRAAGPLSGNSLTTWFNETHVYTHVCICLQWGSTEMFI